MYAHGSGWRIEEFLQGYRVVRVDELSDPKVYLPVARKLANLHALKSSEISGRPPVSFSRLENWANAARQSFGEISPEISSAIRDMQIRLKQGLESCKLGYRVVFAHNDLQENNLLINEDGDVQFIDFEYADMNFQGADIGNFFGEFTMDYLVPEPPLFKIDESKFPSRHIQEEFAQEYLKVYLGAVPSRAQIDELLDSVHTFRQLSHLLWGLWALVRASQKAETDFGFVAYANARFAAYSQNEDKAFVL